MGKLELEAKDETVGILEEDWQTKALFWVASFSVVLWDVLATLSLLLIFFRCTSVLLSCCVVPECNCHGR
jgi:hypothetical protein